MSGRESGARPLRRSGRSGSATKLRILGVVGVVALATAPLAGQDASLGELEAEHRNAVREYELAVDVAADQRQAWEERLTALEQARIDGTEEDYEAAYRALDEAFRELRRMETRVAELRRGVDETRSALLVALEQRLQALETRFAAVTDPVESRRVRSRILDVTAQYRSLRDESIAPDPASLLYSPSITLDPRDGPPQLRFKVGWLERRVAEADSAIVRAELELDRLRAEQRIQQASGDFRAGLDRFGDTRLPTGPPRPTSTGEGEIPADSVAAQDARPLERQIQETLELRERLVEFRDATAKKAEEFRDRLRRITE